VKELSKSDIAMAIVMICCGGFILLIASGVVPAQSANDTPMWVVGLAGVVFVIAGVMIMLRNYSRLLDLFAALILASFAIIGGWVAFFGSAEGFSGGIPFLPHDMNVSLARSLFGFGAFLCCAMFVYALRRFVSPSDPTGKQGHNQS
jgi:hypothetical protein